VSAGVAVAEKLERHLRTGMYTCEVDALDAVYDFEAKKPNIWLQSVHISNPCYRKEGKKRKIKEPKVKLVALQ